MRSSGTEHDQARAQRVRCSADSLTVELSDGRSLTVPLEWYPRLLHGSARERSRWELVGDGNGIHWPDLDEDISIEGLLAGRRSLESPGSFSQWLAGRG